MPASRSMDVAAASSLGVLLGLLIGLSASPIVATVGTALVALLGALFGFSEKISPNLTSAAARRIVSFGIAAVFATILAVLARTHDWLAPSVDSQRSMLTELGIRDAKEQTEMLRFLRFGILPASTTSAPKGSPAATAAAVHDTVLFSAPGDFCRSFLQFPDGSPQDLLALLDQQTQELRRFAVLIRGLPEDQQRQMLIAGRIYLCGVR
jgi:hypothetical protein